MMRNRMLSASATIFLALSSSGAAFAETDLDVGRKIFTKTAEPSCAICHSLADAGSEGEVGPKLDELKPTAGKVRAAVTSGVGVMPAYGDTLTEEQIATVAAYISEVTGGAETTGSE